MSEESPRVLVNSIRSLLKPMRRSGSVEAFQKFLSTASAILKERRGEAVDRNQQQK